MMMMMHFRGSRSPHVYASWWCKMMIYMYADGRVQGDTFLRGIHFLLAWEFLLTAAACWCTGLMRIDTGRVGEETHHHGIIHAVCWIYFWSFSYTYSAAAWAADAAAADDDACTYMN